jgi:hypothetical protein
MKAREINSMIRYTMWSVFRRVGQLDDPPMETADATGAGNRSRHERR